METLFYFRYKSHLFIKATRIRRSVNRIRMFSGSRREKSTARTPRVHAYVCVYYHVTYNRQKSLNVYYSISGRRLDVENIFYVEL